MARLRVEYEAAGLDEDMLDPDPMEQFRSWFTAAVDAGVPQANTFVVATATADGIPSARAVLMKGLGPDGVVFYTNTGSRKGRELAHNRRAAGCFVWIELHRQVRLEGAVEEVTPEQADAYFVTRPPGSRLAAAASPQSEVVPGRSFLEERYAGLQERHPDGDVPRPPQWGGYRIVPTEWEFWQGRPNRFHDRLRYRLSEEGWVLERLAP